jgi:F0F1-type ATP synthase membrane subunit b/b'
MNPLALVISFTIVGALLYVFACKPVLRALEERRRIAQGLANDEEINAARAAIEDERRQVIAAAQADAIRIIAEARRVAARVRERETRLALAAMDQIMRETTGRWPN